MNLTELSKEKLLDILEYLEVYKKVDEYKSKKVLIEKIESDSNYPNYVENYHITTSEVYRNYQIEDGWKIYNQIVNGRLKDNINKQVLKLNKELQNIK